MLSLYKILLSWKFLLFLTFWYSLQNISQVRSRSLHLVPILIDGCFFCSRFLLLYFATVKVYCYIRMSHMLWRIIKLNGRKISFQSCRFVKINTVVLSSVFFFQLIDLNYLSWCNSLFFWELTHRTLWLSFLVIVIFRIQGEPFYCQAHQPYQDRKNFSLRFPPFDENFSKVISNSPNDIAMQKRYRCWCLLPMNPRNIMF